jgi:hypothetical protein
LTVSGLRSRICATSLLFKIASSLSIPRLAAVTSPPTGNG